MSKPNVVIITCHDLGDYLGCYGTPVKTPNLDKFAEQGVVMENHFSTGTVCSPSRGSIVTGCYPHTHGLMGLVHRGWELDVDKCPPLPALLNKEGYETNLFGFQHEHYDPYRLGYKHVHKVKSQHCEDVTPVFTDWLARRKGDGQPFLAALGFSEVHRMNMNPANFKRDAYEPANPEEVEVRPYLPDISEVREDLADLYGAINLVDKMVGKIVSALEAAGIRENTLLIFTTDHGASFMHSKATVYDGGTKVALLMQWPGKLPEGHRVTALTSHVDILPTVFELLGIRTPSHVQGKSFGNLLRAEGGEGREYIFAEKNYTNFYDPTRMVRSRSFKYIRKGLRTCIFDFLIPEVELCTSDFRKKREVFEFYSAKRCTEEFYDLEKDPGELNNLIDEPGYQNIINEMKGVLDRHLEETRDPFRFVRNDIMMPVDSYTTLRELRNGR